MKKLAPIIAAALLACTLTSTALAAEQVAPALYPTEVTEHSEGGTLRISKVYDLTATDDPVLIPTADFEREGSTYTLLDLTRQDLTATDTKQHSETVAVESKSKDAEKIISLFATTLDVTAEGGYTGTLALDPDSIKAEVKGYGTSSRAITATRTYPGLSDADTSLVPKTTEDNGRTLTLADVQWQEAEGFYSATATYTGTASSNYATGYIVTATYTGEVSKTTSDVVRYTAIFGGAPVPSEGAEQGSIDWDGLKWLTLPIGAVAVLLIVGITRMMKNKKRRRNTI